MFSKVNNDREARSGELEDIWRLSAEKRECGRGPRWAVELRGYHYRFIVVNPVHIVNNGCEDSTCVRHVMPKLCQFFTLRQRSHCPRHIVRDM